MTQPLDRTAKLPQIGELDEATGEFWRESVFDMGSGADNLSAYEPNRMFLNIDGHRFLDGSFASGCDIDADSRSVIAADFDRDGDSDLLVGSVGGGPLRLFANQNSQDNHSVRLNLVGTSSNRFGIGARATAKIGDRTIVRDLFPANGCLGQSPPELIIGVGVAERIDEIEIRWPNGLTQVVHDVPVDGVLTIKEGQAETSFVKHNAVIRTRPNRVTFVSIDRPIIEPADASSLPSDERVLGLTVAAVSRAYPLRYLQDHHVCHDEIERTPILVSYCSPSRAATAFFRQLSNGKQTLTLEFDVAGMIKSVGYSVLRDRQTKSLWNPLTGQCIKGRLRGTRLKPIPRLVTDWDHWRSLKPSTDLLAADKDNYPDLITDGRQSGSQYVTSTNAVCPPDTMGLGIAVGSQQVFVPLEELMHNSVDAVTIRLNDRNVVVFFDQQHTSVRAFHSSYQNGEALDSQFAASVSGIRSTADGSVFNFEGECIEGPQAGRRLVPVPNASVVRWYAWHATYRASRVYQCPNELAETP